MEEKTRLIKELDEARSAMRGLVETIDKDMELYPGWTIKHVLAHLSGWDEATVSALRSHARGENPVLMAYRGIDDYNAHSVVTREVLNYEQVAREYDMVRDELKTLVNEMMEEKFEGDFLSPWGQRVTVSSLVEIMIHHEREHAEEIRKLIAERSKADKAASA